MSSEIDEDFLLCEKCIQLNKLTAQPKTDKPIALQGEIADVIFNQKTIDDFLPGLIKGYWNSSKSLTGISPHDFRTFDTYELSMFEHIILFRFWHKILE